MSEKMIEDLDTPSLIIDLDQMETNLMAMQDFADSEGVKLRPHTKTHKTAEIAHLQMKYGAEGITVAKVSEAEAMVRAGVSDIFIATEIVGKQKLERIRVIAEKAKIHLAVDSMYHVEQIADFFGDHVPIELMLEIDTGQGRCGVKPDEAVLFAGEMLKRFPLIRLRGIFTHEGHTYNATDKDQMKRIAVNAQADVIKVGKEIKEKCGIDCEISVGCTLAQLTREVLPGITEVRPGTYAFYDAGHAYFLGDITYCAATVLATITSKSSRGDVVADAGAKSMTIDQRSSGVLKTEGFGKIKGHPDLLIKKLSDEHTVIAAGNSLSIGDRIEIIPNHICPTVNLYDRAYGVRNGKIEKVFTINARGCVQ
ncbi:alanine racemase [Virgibacillus necropolis]|uniref:Alanine racemase n=1 Tax=Virgibacillus necropolis TaxID=163877 RepID=A0A221MEJ7_9BACI|nr:alanine racemase [Virgibacillus necropolis]ASN06054.1 alanine racemase [Virgibacillus necropolis]